MKYIQVPLETLINFRRTKNLPLFAESLDNSDEILLYIQVESGIVLESSVSRISDTWTSLRSYANKPIIFYDRRIVSHNFADNTTWPSTDNSLFRINVDPGFKFVIPNIVVRFPISLKLEATNRLKFNVYISMDGVTPITEATPPVISLAYSSIKDLIRKSNIPLSITTDMVPDAFPDEKMVEVSFMYADPHTLFGTPIELRYSLNERIDILLEGNIPVKDINGAALADECWVVVNARRVIYF